MNKRKRSKFYRTIYELFRGPIPVDHKGKTYDIHHIDGNPENNNIMNLVALSREDHFLVHYYQGDLYEAVLLNKNKHLTVEEMSIILSNKAKDRFLKKENHPMYGKTGAKHSVFMLGQNNPNYKTGKYYK